MRHMKRLITLLLTLMIAFSLTVTVSAAVDDTEFVDIDRDAWYAEAVMYCREHGLMNGTSDSTFEPESSLTRAMLVTVLWRLAGSPAVSGLPQFSDVTEGQWYTEGICWAADERLVNGYGNGLFGTDDPITQEQLDLIFRRYTDALVTQDIPDYEGNSRHATRAQVAYALMSIDRAQKSAANDSVLNLTINGTTLTATLADNSSAQALKELLANGPISIDMKDYGNMEKVGPLGTSLPTNNEQINTQPGDIILYQGNQITIYYGTNSWSLTRLGKIDNITAQELRALLGSSEVSVTLSLG